MNRIVSSAFTMVGVVGCMSGSMTLSQSATFYAVGAIYALTAEVVDAVRRFGATNA